VAVCGIYVALYFVALAGYALFFMWTVPAVVSAILLLIASAAGFYVTYSLQRRHKDLLILNKCMAELSGSLPTHAVFCWAGPMPGKRFVQGMISFDRGRFVCRQLWLFKKAVKMACSGGRRIPTTLNTCNFSVAA